MECFCCLRDTKDKLPDMKSPYETRFGTASDGPEFFKILVHRSWNQFMFLCGDGSLRQEGHAQRRESRDSTREGSTQLWARRGVTHEEGGVADFPEADRGDMASTEHVWSTSGGFIATM